MCRGTCASTGRARAHARWCAHYDATLRHGRGRSQLSNFWESLILPSPPGTDAVRLVSARYLRRDVRPVSEPLGGAAVRPAAPASHRSSFDNTTELYVCHLPGMLPERYPRWWLLGFFVSAVAGPRGRVVARGHPPLPGTPTRWCHAVPPGGVGGEGEHWGGLEAPPTLSFSGCELGSVPPPKGGDG